MADRIQICFVKYSPSAKKAYMFEMPADKYINEGDCVMVPSADGEPSEAIVVTTQTFNFEYSTDVKEMDRLLAVSGATLPFKKVIGTVTRHYFKCEEEEVDADEDED